MIRLEGGLELDEYWREVRKTGDERLQEFGFEDWVVTLRALTIPDTGRAEAHEEEPASNGICRRNHLCRQASSTSSIRQSLLWVMVTLRIGLETKAVKHEHQGKAPAPEGVSLLRNRTTEKPDLVRFSMQLAFASL